MILERNSYFGPVITAVKYSCGLLTTISKLPNLPKSSLMIDELFRKKKYADMYGNLNPAKCIKLYNQVSDMYENIKIQIMTEIEKEYGVEYEFIYSNLLDYEPIPCICGANKCQIFSLKKSYMDECFKRSILGI